MGENEIEAAKTYVIDAARELADAEAKVALALSGDPSDWPEGGNHFKAAKDARDRVCEAVAHLREVDAH